MKTITVLLSVIFCCFIILWEKQDCNVEKTDIKEQAKVIESAIWNLDPEGPQQYLNVAARLSNYESITVFSLSDETPFIKINVPTDKALNKLFIRLGLIPKKQINTLIYHKDIKIGRMEVVHLHDNIYLYMFVLLVLILIWIGVKFYLQTIDAKHTLELKVEEKTREFQKSEENMRITLKSIGDGVIATDTEGRITQMNLIAEKLTGWLHEEAIGKPLLEVLNIININTRKPCNSPIEKVLHAGSIMGFTDHTILLSRDKTEYQVANSAAPIRNDDNQTIGAVLVVRDITEEYKLKEKVLDSETKYRTLFQSSQDAILLLGEDENYQDANPAAMKLFLIPSKKKLLQTTLSILSPKYQPTGELSTVLGSEYLEKALSDGTCRFEWTHKKLDGTTFLASVLVTSIIVGKKAMLQGTIRDITKERETQKRLNNISKMDAIGQLAGGVAHDFNNMICGIAGVAQVLKNKNPNLDQESTELINLISKTSNRASDLTAKLLAFGRQTTLSMTNIKISEILNDTKEFLNRTINKNISVSFSSDTKKDMIRGDYSELENVFMNIGINASHAMINGGTIQINTKNIYLDHNYCDISSFDLISGDYIKITIKDTGCGISPDDIQKIFDPFFTTKEQGKGTGLGLAAVYGIVKSHHGEVTVHSEIDIGTSFHIMLPCSEGNINSKTKASGVVHGEGKILLVDDEQIIRTIGDLLLKDMGYDVILAEDGLQGVNIFKEQHDDIDLVLMDLTMPVMSGVEAFYKMRKIDPSVKVIITSGYAQADGIDELRTNGLAGFITKPFSDFELSKIISTVLT